MAVHSERELGIGGRARFSCAGSVRCQRGARAASCWIVVTGPLTLARLRA